jgi:hypothetical protein
MKINTWNNYKKGKYLLTILISTSIKYGGEFGIIWEKNPAFTMYRKCWQFRICLGWFNLYLYKFENESENNLV